MPIKPLHLPWWAWLLCALVAWAVRGFFEGPGSKGDGERISGPLAFLAGAVAFIAGMLAVVSLFQTLWSRPQ